MLFLLMEAPTYKYLTSLSKMVLKLVLRLQKIPLKIQGNNAIRVINWFKLNSMKTETLAIFLSKNRCTYLRIFIEFLSMI